MENTLKTAATNQNAAAEAVRAKPAQEKAGKKASRLEKALDSMSKIATIQAGKHR